MRHGPWALRLVAPLLAVAATAAAQQEPKPKDLPDAPAAKQESAPQKRDNPFHATVEILGRRSIFFPDIATSAGPLSVKQKFELFADESVAPSRFLSSAAGAGISQARNSLDGYGHGGIDEFFRNVCHFVSAAPRPALLPDAARGIRASPGIRAEPHRRGAHG